MRAVRASRPHDGAVPPPRQRGRADLPGADPTSGGIGRSTDRGRRVRSNAVAIGSRTVRDRMVEPQPHRLTSDEPVDVVSVRAGGPCRMPDRSGATLEPFEVLARASDIARVGERGGAASTPWQTRGPGRPHDALAQARECTVPGRSCPQSIGDGGWSSSDHRSAAGTGLTRCPHRLSRRRWAGNAWSSRAPGEIHCTVRPSQELQGRFRLSVGRGRRARQHAVRPPVAQASSRSSGSPS